MQEAGDAKSATRKKHNNKQLTNKNKQNVTNNTNHGENIVFIQINANRNRTATDLIIAEMQASAATIGIIAEPNKRLATHLGWYTDYKEDAALAVWGNIPIKNTGKGQGYVWIELKSWIIYSCYI